MMQRHRDQHSSFAGLPTGHTVTNSLVVNTKDVSALIDSLNHSKKEKWLFIQIKAGIVRWLLVFGSLPTETEDL